MWQEQCSKERAAKYGRVMAHALSEDEYELNPGRNNPRYLVTGKEHANEKTTWTGEVDYDEIESWRASGRDITPNP